MILLQLILLGATAFISAWAFLQDHLRISGFYFLILFVLEIIGLYAYLTRQNRDLLSFLKGLAQREELSKLNESGTRKEINQLMNRIAKSYSNVKIDKESEHQYLLNTVKHVNIGLLSFTESGIIELFNTALEKLLEIRAPKKVETLKRISDDLPGLLKNMKPGIPVLYKLNRNGKILHLSIHATTFKLKGSDVRLVSIQDIASEIQQEEIEIWQKLIRVLTHEIMNSAGPITSLSSTLLKLAENLDVSDLKTQEKLMTGLAAIEKRSNGLARFVETYRSLTRVPEPVISNVSVKGIIDQVLLFSRPEFEKYRITTEVDIRPVKMAISVDEKLIMQVLINIVKNAIEALAEGYNTDKGIEKPKIKITAKNSENGRTYITIKNNGPVISAEILDKVFIPFYSTKSSGSGIGLSLSRQIMQKHGGSIGITSSWTSGTEVILEF